MDSLAFAPASASGSKRRIEEAFPPGCSQSSNDEGSEAEGWVADNSGPITWQEVEASVPTRESAGSAGHASCANFGAYVRYMRMEHGRIEGILGRLSAEQRSISWAAASRPVDRWRVDSPPFRRVPPVFPADMSSAAHRRALRGALNQMLPDADSVSCAAGHAASNGVHAWRAYTAMASQQIDLVFMYPPSVVGGITDSAWVQARVTEAVESALAME